MSSSDTLTSVRTSVSPGAESLYIPFISGALNGPYVSQPHPEQLVAMPQTCSSLRMPPFWEVVLHLPGYQDRNQEASSRGPLPPTPHPVSLQAPSLAGPSGGVSKPRSPHLPSPTPLLPSQPSRDLQPSFSSGPWSVCSVHVL